jgi:uncharacterized protein YjiS (DUF1127 family)
MSELKGEKILLTGPTSQVAWPIAQALARTNEVYGLARLSDAADRERLKDIGVRRCRSTSAVTRSTTFPPTARRSELRRHQDRRLRLRFDRERRRRRPAAVTLPQSTRVPALLFCRRLRASAGPIKEDGALGDSHRSMFPTYSLAKIARKTSSVSPRANGTCRRRSRVSACRTATTAAGPGIT